MGSGFFKTQKPGSVSGGNANQLARGMNAGSFAGRGASIGAIKDIAAAQALTKAHAAKPLARSAAYPKGPKV